MKGVGACAASRAQVLGVGSHRPAVPSRPVPRRLAIRVVFWLVVVCCRPCRLSLAGLCLLNVRTEVWVSVPYRVCEEGACRRMQESDATKQSSRTLKFLTEAFRFQVIIVDQAHGVFCKLPTERFRVSCS